jgi:hypothetical protein
MNEQPTEQNGCGDVPLTDEDRTEMTRLSEQAISSFVKMAEIASRTLGRKRSVQGVTTVVFSAVEQPVVVRDGRTLELRISPQVSDDKYALFIDDEGHCIVYEDPPGVCRTCRWEPAL